MIIPILTPSGSEAGTALVGWEEFGGIFVWLHRGATYLRDPRKPGMPAALRCEAQLHRVKSCSL